MQSKARAPRSNLGCEFLSISQLSAWLGVSEKFLRKHNAAGRIPGSTRMGSRWMFRRSSIEKQMIESGKLLVEEMAENDN